MSKILVLSSIILLLLVLCSDIPVIAQTAHPKLFPFSEEEALIAWKSETNNENYTAQFISKNGQLIDEKFPIYSNELIVSNVKEEFMVTKTFNFPATEYWPATFSIKAKIYHTIHETTPSFGIAGGSWPLCGMDFLGYENVLTGIGQNFLYIDQFDGDLDSRLYDNSGKVISSVNGTENTYHISADALTDSSYMVVWFNARHDDVENTMPYGIYATSITQDKIIRDSVQIKTYPNFPEYLTDANPRIIPKFKVRSLNDSTYQLFVVETDSLFFYSYLLNPEAKIREVNKFSIPVLYESYRLSTSELLTLNVSNYSENTRSVFFSISGYVNNSRCTSNYLYYFNDQGHSSGEPITDTSHVFNKDYFKFKTGTETYLNAAQRHINIYADTYHHFSLTDSLKIGKITSIDSRIPDIANSFKLQQNYPNPFNPTTTIEFTLNRPGKATIEIYDITGKAIETLVDAHKTAGRHQITFDGSDLSSGVYLYRLTTDHGYTKMFKMVLIK
ncbi:MAG: T9SS type A sorting domain-containing protein [Caldithrix sp.]|nr:T9SS type A sorting domain-containing protein [Caldithrix sp.]